MLTRTIVSIGAIALTACAATASSAQDNDSSFAAGYGSHGGTSRS